jgi:adenylate cyclase
MAKSKNKQFIKVTLAACVVSSLLFFTSLDNKLFDLFLRFLPSLTENEKVYVLTLDDDSIAYAGGFPFRREVMADVVILLKELEVNSIAFDLSYLDESPYRLDPDYAMDAFGQHLDIGFSDLNAAAVSVIDGITARTTREDRQSYKEDIRYLHDMFREELESFVAFLARDVDEYFAQALAFSDCSWVTLTMIRPEDVFTEGSGEVQITTDEDIDSYLAEYISLKNIINIKDTKTPEMIGVMPAIRKLMSRAKGAGFVNANPDVDGLRRRINMVIKYKGEYYGHLALMAMIEKLGVSSIEVSNKAVTLKRNNGEDLFIPRTQDGTTLLKWPKKSFYDYKIMSLIGLIQHTMIEPALSQNIFLMYDSGFFLYWDGGANPWDYYSKAEKIKNEAFAVNGAAGAEWINARKDFFDTCEKFLYGPYEENILADVGDDQETAEFVRELFGAAKSQYRRIAEIRKSAAVLNDSLCIIGSDATSMTDNGLITFQENYPNVGSYAVAANMMLSGEFLDDAPWYVPAIIALLYSLIIGFLISRFDTYASITTGISGLLLLSGVFVTLFLISKTYIGFAVPLAATSLTFISIMVTKFLTASHEKAFLHNAFSRYLAPEVITDIINNPDKLNLGGEKREMTAIFTDIQGFSTISEQLDPTQLVKLLNRYLTAMSNIIMEKLGTIDKYEGDAIIAFFGAPVSRPDHPALACRSAIAMKTAERELNKVVLEEKLSPVPLFTRIGINTGEMVVGNMGAENKMDYTIMGNAVNLAARLEGVNKQYHTGGILISEYTKEKIGDEFLLRRLDRVRVVGIHTPLRLYELLTIKSETPVQELQDVEQWEQAIDLFEKMQFAQAQKIFLSLKEKNPNDKVAEFYAGRCVGYIENPPPKDWDAVKNLTEK